MVQALLEKKKVLEAQDQQVELDILLDFLNKTKAQKMESYKTLKKQISCLDHDIATIEAQKESIPDVFDNSVFMKDSSKEAQKEANETALAGDVNTPKKLSKGLLSFSRNLSRFTRFNDFRVITTLKYGDLFNTSSIVSSIEFDKDDEYFATAGVTKKIKVFEYAQIAARDHVDVHAPVKEMTCRSKISCLSWNTYIKSQIASSDYEGIITLWDVNTGQDVMSMEEHEKRVWSVDFSRTDPTQLASGSDDTRVKLWSTTSRRAITTIESKANICCVKFNPSSSYLIAFGSADHHIHYYDLRHPKDPLFVFKGHRKAVSYVKFLNKDEIVSASTDSTLKLWNVNQNECVRTYVGHANEKNFVGLTVSGDYICCGSENNGVYTYYKTLSKPIVTHRFGANSGTTLSPSTDGLVVGQDNNEGSSFFFKGSVVEAINKAKKDEAMFVVLVYEQADTDLVDILEMDEEMALEFGDKCLVICIESTSDDAKNLKQFSQQPQAVVPKTSPNTLHQSRLVNPAPVAPKKTNSLKSPPVVKEPPPPPVYKSTTIVCKLTNGHPIKSEFAASDRLSDVKSFIDNSLDLLPSATITISSLDPNIKPTPAPEASPSSSNIKYTTSHEPENEGFLSGVKGYMSKFFTGWYEPSTPVSTTPSPAASKPAPRRGGIHTLSS
eukprot:gene1374-1577_t